jgi:hypothetical protein
MSRIGGDAAISSVSLRVLTPSLRRLIPAGKSVLSQAYALNLEAGVSVKGTLSSGSTRGCHE